MMFKELLKRASHVLPDKMYIKLKFYSRMGRFPDLKNPKTFNEKLQWLKLYNRNPEYTRMVDKYEAKKYVANIIGEEYIIPTLGVWDKFDDIDFDKLPDQFVLKCTHDSGGLVICRDKSQFNKDTARKKINKCLKTNYYWHGREWPYKDVKPRIIVEKYVEDKAHPEQLFLLVYKIMCFDGVPKIIQTIQGDKTASETIDYFDTEWNLLHIRQNYPNSTIPLERPKSFETMLSLATKMSVGYPFLRVDFYECEGRPLFSEFTFFSDSGLARFYPGVWDYELGNWITLPDKTRG